MGATTQPPTCSGSGDGGVGSGDGGVGSGDGGVGSGDVGGAVGVCSVDAKWSTKHVLADSQLTD